MSAIPHYPFFVIHHKSEETACTNCGCPLYVGDTVYFPLHDDRLQGCCPECVQELLYQLTRTSAELYVREFPAEYSA
jgi:RNase P subunit RPR2